MASRVESLLLDPSFDYLQPYFYRNPYALRCELGRGRRYMANARRRAMEIDRILFPRGADAISFNVWSCDWTDSSEAWTETGEVGHSLPRYLKSTVEREMRALRFLLEYEAKYRHVSVKGLRNGLDPEDPDHESIRLTRVVCYADDRGFDDRALLRQQIASDLNSEVSLVSFENECILSVYDDRGCDVVFADPASFRAFYPLLEPYFLPYDRKEMARRLAECP